MEIYNICLVEDRAAYRISFLKSTLCLYREVERIRDCVVNTYRKITINVLGSNVPIRAAPIAFV